MATYLGVDQSLNSTGVCILEDGTHKPVYMTTISAGKRRGGERLELIYSEILYAVKRWAPVQGALEGYSFGSTHRSFDLGEAAGMVKLACYQNKVPLIVVAPTALKKFVGDSQADKDKVRVLVKQLWGEDIDQNDACDAYGLAQVARAFVTPYKLTVRAQLEVVHSLLPSKKITTLTLKTTKVNV